MSETNRGAFAWTRRGAAIGMAGVLAATLVAGAPNEVRAEWPEQPITLVVL